MIVGTPSSRRLCRDIAKRTDCVVLGFSRGKDAVASWLWLLEFFPRVIPVHANSAPGTRFVDESLAYYERFFGTRILRYPSRTIMRDLAWAVYQPVEDDEFRESLPLEDVALDNLQLCNAVRDWLAPDAWVALGISTADSIERRSQAKYRAGREDAKRLFFPCHDWTRATVMQAIESSGVRLADDYLLGNRSYSGVATARHLRRMRDKMPADFARLRLLYPLVEAGLARMEFRQMRSAGSGTGVPSAKPRRAAKSSSAKPSSDPPIPRRRGRQSSKSTTQKETP